MEREREKERERERESEESKRVEEMRINRLECRFFAFSFHARRSIALVSVM